MYPYVCIIYISICDYVCFYINEFNNNNDKGMGERNQNYLIIIKYLYYLGKGILLLESGLGLVVNAYR